MEKKENRNNVTDSG